MKAYEWIMRACSNAKRSIGKEEWRRLVLKDTFLERLMFLKQRSATVDVAEVISVMASWSQTKIIATFDATLAEAIGATPIDHRFPGSLLRRLPANAIALTISDIPDVVMFVLVDRQSILDELRDDAPQITFASVQYIEHDVGDGSGRKQMSFDVGCVAVMAVDGPVDVTSLDDATGITLDRALHSHQTDDRLRKEQIARWVSMALYLCSEEPDVDAIVTSKSRHDERRGTRGPLIANAITPVNVGFRVGAALRAANAHDASRGSEGTGRSHVPHVRRAHWHTYWVGSEAMGTRTRKLKWLMPILVNAESPEDLPTTARAVRAPGLRKRAADSGSKLEVLAAAPGEGSNNE